jgi:hypothetical protein
MKIPETKNWNLGLLILLLAIAKPTAAQPIIGELKVVSGNIADIGTEGTADFASYDAEHGVSFRAGVPRLLSLLSPYNCEDADGGGNSATAVYFTGGTPTPSLTGGTSFHIANRAGNNKGVELSFIQNANVNKIKIYLADHVDTFHYPGTQALANLRVETDSGYVFTMNEVQLPGPNTPDPTGHIGFFASGLLEITIQGYPGNSVRIYNLSAIDGVQSGIQAVSASALPDSLPTLTVTKNGANYKISWPQPTTGFSLQENNNFNDPNGWSDYGGSVNSDGTNYYITIPPAAGQKFYRLKK